MHPLVSPGRASEQARGARSTLIHNATSNAAAAIAATAAADTRLAAATTCTAFSSSNRAPAQHHHHHHLCFIVSIIRATSRPSGQLGRPLKCSSQSIASPALQHRTYSERPSVESSATHCEVHFHKQSSQLSWLAIEQEM